MAAPGTNFNRTVEIADEPTAVSQALVQATAATAGYTVSNAGTGSIILTRKYIPTWAVVLGVIGLLLFLIGALLFLYRVTETLTVTITPTEGGSRVTVSGLATAEMMQRITSALNGMPALESSSRLDAHDGQSETKTCPACAEDVKAAATVCRFCGHEFKPEQPPALTS